MQKIKVGGGGGGGPDLVGGGGVVGGRGLFVARLGVVGDVGTGGWGPVWGGSGRERGEGRV